MENVCRLCAIEKAPKELAYRIDDETLNIEQKLIDCCRWNSLVEEEHGDLPKWICGACFQKLEQSWEFAENVAQAQNTLYASTEITPLVLLKIEKVDIPLNDDEFSVEEEIHEYFPQNVVSEDKYTEIQGDRLESLVLNKRTPNISDYTLTEYLTTKDDIDLLASILDSDKNNDGTVNSEKIAQLDLDDWSVVKWKCWKCQEQFDKHRTLRFHFKQNHKENELRIHCTLCHSSYAKKYLIYNHVIKFHRPYLKFW